MLPDLPFNVPLPFVTAALAGLIAGRLATGSGTPLAARVLFAALFALFALQAALVGLRFGYGFEAVIRIQRVAPLLVGPLAFLAFAALAGETDWRKQLLRHGLMTAGIVVACLLLPQLFRLVDPLITASFVVYTTLLWRLWKRGPDAFAATPLIDATTQHRWLLRTIVLLTCILATDIVIAVDFALTGGRHTPTLIAAASLLLIPAFVATAVNLPAGATSQPSSPAKPGADDADLMDRLATLLDETRLHHDPDLTLARLARRLGVPARRLSAAINAAAGVNASQYVNERRIRDAATLLTGSTDSAAAIGERVGFGTRSNFYREFQRIHAMTPTRYRELNSQ